MVDRNRYNRPAGRYQPPSRRKRRGWLVVIIGCMVLLGGRTAWSKLQTKPQLNSQKSSQPKRVEPKVETISDTTWRDLNQKLSALLAQQSKLNIPISVIDENSGTQANYGVQEAFHGASTTKVLTAVAYLHDVEAGRRTLGENLGGGSAESHLRRMINRSDNNAWAVLNAAVGSTRLESYAHANGISSYKYLGNLMTSRDQASLLNKLHKGQLLNESHRNLLLSFMQATNNEDMIPAALPPGATIYHKYGQLEDRLHDSAIINYKAKPIVIVIYTKGTADGNLYTARTQLIQTIAQTVFSTIYPR